MRYITHAFRHADVILQEEEFRAEYEEIIQIIDNLTDERVVERHNSYKTLGKRTPKSISVAINELLKEDFIARDWRPESPIFQETEYTGDKWRLDFAKTDISIEVAFNHSGSIAWNLIKPALASELNHVQKAIQTKIGVIITATNGMKAAGGFDGAIGTFELFQTYLKPFNSILTVPVLLIGLEAPETFRINHIRPERGGLIGEVVYY